MVDRDTMHSDVVPHNSNMPVIDGDVVVLGSDFVLTAQTGLARYADEHIGIKAGPLAIDKDTHTASLPPYLAVRSALGILSMRRVALGIKREEAEKPLVDGSPAPAVERQLDILERHARGIGSTVLERYPKNRVYRRGYFGARRLEKQLRSLKTT